MCARTYVRGTNCTHVRSRIWHVTQTLHRYAHVDSIVVIRVCVHASMLAACTAEDSPPQATVVEVVQAQPIGLDSGAGLGWSELPVAAEAEAARLVSEGDRGADTVTSLSRTSSPQASTTQMAGTRLCPEDFRLVAARYPAPTSATCHATSTCIRCETTRSRKGVGRAVVACIRVHVCADVCMHVYACACVCMHVHM